MGSSPMDGKIHQRGKHPLAVSTLTTHAASSASSTPLDDRTGVKERRSSEVLNRPQNRSAPFECDSVEETLKSHGASRPTRSPRFIFQMRQEPRQGLAAGTDETAFKNARAVPLDPMPICELVPETREDGKFISLPELSVQARLVSSTYPFEEVPSVRTAIDPLINGVQESGFIAPIVGRHEECLFVFAELGVRLAGQYRIRFDLIDRVGLSFKKIARIYTQTFDVVAEKRNFAGLSPSTELVHQLVRRGLKLRLTKDQQAAKRAGLQSNSWKKRKTSTGSSSDLQQASPSNQEAGRFAGDTSPYSQQDGDMQMQSHTPQGWHQHSPQLPLPTVSTTRSPSHSSRDPHMYPHQQSSYRAGPIVTSPRVDASQPAPEERSRIPLSAGWPRKKLPAPFPPGSLSRPDLSLPHPSLFHSAKPSLSPPSYTSASASFEFDRPYVRARPSLPSFDSSSSGVLPSRLWESHLSERRTTASTWPPVMSQSTTSRPHSREHRDHHRERHSLGADTAMQYDRPVLPPISSFHVRHSEYERPELPAPGPRYWQDDRYRALDEYRRH